MFALGSSKQDQLLLRFGNRSSSNKINYSYVRDHTSTPSTAVALMASVVVARVTGRSRRDAAAAYAGLRCRLLMLRSVARSMLLPGSSPSPIHDVALRPGSSPAAVHVVAAAGMGLWRDNEMRAVFCKTMLDARQTRDFDLTACDEWMQGCTRDAGFTGYDAIYIIYNLALLR